MEPEPPFLPRAGADPSRSEPESVLGPRPFGAAQKCGGSVTLTSTEMVIHTGEPLEPEPHLNCPARKYRTTSFCDPEVVSVN